MAVLPVESGLVLAPAFARATRFLTYGERLENVAPNRLYPKLSGSAVAEAPPIEGRRAFSSPGAVIQFSGTALPIAQTMTFIAQFRVKELAAGSSYFFGLASTTSNNPTIQSLVLTSTGTLQMVSRSTSLVARLATASRTHAVGEIVTAVGVVRAANNRSIYLGTGDIANNTGNMSDSNPVRVILGGHAYTGYFPAMDFSLLAVLDIALPANLALRVAADPWKSLFRDRRIWVPVSTGGSSLPTLGTPTYVPGSLTTTGFRPRVPFNF